MHIKESCRKVENWLQKNRFYIMNSTINSDSNSHASNQLETPKNNTQNRINDDKDSAQSVDTAKYILSNNKKTKAKTTTMTIKEYCHQSSKQEQRQRTTTAAAKKKDSTLNETQNTNGTTNLKLVDTINTCTRQLRPRKLRPAPPTEPSPQSTSSENDKPRSNRKRRKKANTKRKTRKD